MAAESALADQLPLALRLPPGWPEPTDEWLLGHQGADIPRDWVPADGCSPAEPGWQFWARNTPVWNDLVQRRRASVQRVIVWGIAALVAGIVVNVLGFGIFGATYGTTGAGGLLVVSWCAVLWGAIVAIRSVMRIRRVESDTMEAILRASRDAKHEQDRAAYREYLSSYGWLT